MSVYHRLISYIYAYEGGVKGKNTGFAKLETRGTSCRIQVSVRRIFVGTSPIGVYLLAGQDEIRIGTLFVRGGNGEFRTVVNGENIEGSGCSMEECCGLTLHETDSAWRAYTTIWEDAVAHAAEVELADVTAENVREQEAEKEEAARKLAERAQEAESWEAEEQVLEREKTERTSENAASSEQIEMEERVLEKRIPEKVEAEENVSGEVDSAPVEVKKSEENSIDEEIEAGNTQIEKEKWDVPSESEKPGETESQNRVAETEKTETANINEMLLETSQPQPEQPEDSNLEIFEDTEAKEEGEDIDHQEAESFREAQTKAQKESPAASLWNRLRALYPKVTAFECTDGCEILVIKPQDIGLLPRENWVYGNNSFLLHGYYNYRYLILARLGKTGEQGRYILGVPGHYGNNEKYMAAMFGFEHFVRSTRQPPRDSRFGYWYTDLNFT